MSRKKIFVLVAMIFVVFVAGFGILLTSAYSANAPDRMILDFLQEIPVKSQKYTLAGESESWRVECDRYDGFILEGGGKRLLQEITLTLDYIGPPEAAAGSVPVNFSMEVSSMLSDRSRQVARADTLVSDGGYSTIWYSSSGYVDNGPTDRLPGKDESLSIEITMNGKTETVSLREANSGDGAE